MNFNIDDLTIIALLLDEDEKKEKRRQHWVHPIWKFRDTEGEFATLYRELVDHQLKFHGPLNRIEHVCSAPNQSKVRRS